MAAAAPRDPLAWCVTTARHPDEELERQARQLAHRLGLEYWPRRGRPLDPARAGPGRAFLVVERGGLAVHAGGRRIVYHPGMAVHRVRALREGHPDPMVEAMGLTGGEQVLDATLGLGSDALVAAFAVGPRGRVTGLEKVAALAALVEAGLASYPWRDPALAEAARRIEVRAADHRAFLAACPPGSFDVVYFDAMFERSLPGSASMAEWRQVADESPVEMEALQQARRVARRRVVLKERADSRRLARLEPPRLVGGRSSRVVFAVWELGGAGAHG
ncbi:MAG TPA: class I SAM-dependent methyltransferase [Limnochordales bacterium]